MSWGVKIAVLYVSFVILIITMVSMSMNQKVELVASDYYEQELKYQDRIDGQANYELLNLPIEYKINGKSIEVIFPQPFIDRNMVGTILIYRPSDSSLDIKTPIRLTLEGHQIIASDKFRRGLYKVQIEWGMEGKRYFTEKNLFMN